MTDACLAEQKTLQDDADGLRTVGYAAYSDGKRVAAAFIGTQRVFVESWLSGGEALESNDPAVGEVVRRIGIEALEAHTGLGFGGFRHHDVYDGEPTLPGLPTVGLLRPRPEREPEIFRRVRPLALAGLRQTVQADDRDDAVTRAKRSMGSADASSGLVPVDADLCDFVPVAAGERYGDV